jgi:dolichol-phosphate mannosyltransferase
VARPELSLVVPIHNQEQSLPQLDERLQRLFAVLPPASEALFVDDGSTDGSLEKLRQLAGREPRYRVLALSRHFGHERAIVAGLDKSRGAAVIVFDAEVDEPSEVVPEMLARWRSGYAVVHARRRRRITESTFDVVATKVFERVFSFVTPVRVPPSTGDLRLVSRPVVRALRGLDETHRFVRGLVAWTGFKQTVVDYDSIGAPARRPSPFARLRAAFDLVTSFSTTPLALASVVSFAASLVAFLCALIALVTSGTALAVLGAIFFAVTFLVLGTLGTYVGRIYEEVKRRPLYVVSERINFRPRKSHNLSTSDLAEISAAPTPPVVAPVAPTPPPPPVAPPPSTALKTTLAMRPQPTPAPPKVAPSVAPPKVTPSVAPPKVTPSVAPPKVTPSVAPPSVSPQSVAPPKVTPSTKPPSVSPGPKSFTFPKAPSVPPKAGSVPPKSTAGSDPKKLFGASPKDTTEKPAPTDPPKPKDP